MSFGRNKTLAVALGVLAGSALTEVALRIIEATPLWRVLPVVDASLYGPDKDTGYAHRRDARGIRTPENRVVVPISHLGLRDKLDRALEKSTGTIRWAVAGDSIVEAQQVPLSQTFVALTEKALNSPSGGKVEVVNLGLAGARPAVVIERLRTRGVKLALDGLVVVVSGPEFLNPQPDDPREYAGYVAGRDGLAVISHAFRDSRGYRLRTSFAGRAIYASVDASRLALIVNNRKNVGLLADLSATPSAAATGARDPCANATLDGLASLWSGRSVGFAERRLSAFLDDLAMIARHSNHPIFVGLRGLTDNCPAHAKTAAGSHEAVLRRLDAAGLGFINMDAEVARLLGRTESMRDLHGFGARIGSVHLNQRGHRIYAQVLTSVIAKQFP